MTALGGGHGLAVTLASARRYAGELTAVVSVADDGGSSGRLREMIGIPAPGDLRRCLGALADPDSVWTKAFEYRFPADGELAGHALGNLVIAVLAEVSGDFATALEHAARLLKVEGRVLAATTIPVDLVARIDGCEVVGQVKVARSRQKIEELSLLPVAPPASAEAVEAIRSADQVILGPGSLYTSVLACAVVPDLKAALAARGSAPAAGGARAAWGSGPAAGDAWAATSPRSAGRVFVANLRADEPEAGGFSPGEQLRVLLDHGIGVDVMVYDPARSAPMGGKPGESRLGEEIDGVRCVAAAVTRSDGTGHDPQRLAAVLADLARTPG